MGVTDCSFDSTFLQQAGCMFCLHSKMHRAWHAWESVGQDGLQGVQRKSLQTCSTAVGWGSPDWLPADRLPGGAWYPEGAAEACCGEPMSWGFPSGRSRPVGGGSGGNVPPAGEGCSPAAQDSTGGCRVVKWSPLDSNCCHGSCCQTTPLPTLHNSKVQEVTCRVVTASQEPPGSKSAGGELSGPAAGYITPAPAQQGVSLVQGTTPPAGEGPRPGSQDSA